MIYEDSYHTVIAGLGALTEGYILIVPKSHYHSVGELPYEMIEQLDLLKTRVRTNIKSAYSSDPIFFEHGSHGSEQPSGACVSHVHIHAFICDFDFRNILNQTLPEKRINKLVELKNLIKLGMPYFFFENQNAEMFYYPVSPDIEPQFFRKLWAKAIKKADEWDWRIYCQETNVANTIKKLRSEFGPIR